MHSKLWTPDWDNIYDEPLFGTYVTVSGGHHGDPESRREQVDLMMHGIAVKQDITIQETHFAR